VLAKMVRTVLSAIVVKNKCQSMKKVALMMTVFLEVEENGSEYNLPAL
jgi:hypothetical protein